MSMYDTYTLRVQIAGALPREPEGETLASLASRLRVQNAVNDYQMPLELCRKIVKELERDGHAVKVGRSSPARWAFTWGAAPRCHRVTSIRGARGKRWPWTPHIGPTAGIVFSLARRGRTS
jgi:hypothetical protein